MGLVYKYIHLQLVDLYIELVGKYSIRPMDPMGYSFQMGRFFLSKSQPRM